MLRDIQVIWAPSGFQPVTAKQGKPFGNDIKSALEAALGQPPQGFEGYEPWLRAGTGIGAEIVNRQGIEMLRQIYNAGAENGTPI